jgi:hypothetical protein
MGLENVPRCQHVKANGTQCGSPALRRRRLCFFHKRVQEMRVRVISDESTQGKFCMPVLEDANGVQMALMQVLEQLAWGRMDHKTAGLMLYGLQTASINLRNTRLDVVDPTEVVIDRDTVHLTCIGGPQWVEEDFDEEEEDEESDVEAQDVEGQDVEEEDVEEEDADAEPAAAAASGQAAGAVKKAVKADPPAAETRKDSANGREARPPVAAKVNMDEVRENVKGLARNWIMETLEGQASRELG